MKQANFRSCGKQVLQGTTHFADARDDAAAALIASLLSSQDDLECMQLINKLRSVEADSVNVLCDNPEGPPNNAVECNGGWTVYRDRRFGGDTLLAALRSAGAAFDRMMKDGSE